MIQTATLSTRNNIHTTTQQQMLNHVVSPHNEKMLVINVFRKLQNCRHTVMQTTRFSSMQVTLCDR